MKENIAVIMNIIEDVKKDLSDNEYKEILENLKLNNDVESGHTTLLTINLIEKIKPKISEERFTEIIQLLKPKVGAEPKMEAKPEIKKYHSPYVSFINSIDSCCSNYCNCCNYFCGLTVDEYGNPRIWTYPFLFVLLIIMVPFFLIFAPFHFIYYNDYEMFKTWMVAVCSVGFTFLFLWPIMLINH